MNDVLALLLILALLIGVISIFVKVSQSLRKGGGSWATICLGATDEFYSHDQKKAIEVIVNKNANKKMEEQDSSEPES